MKYTELQEAQVRACLGDRRRLQDAYDALKISEPNDLHRLGTPEVRARARLLEEAVKTLSEVVDDLGDEGNRIVRRARVKLLARLAMYDAHL